jgi:TPR repeat protein
MQNRLKALKEASPNNVAKKIPQDLRDQTHSFLTLREIFGSFNRVCVGFYKDTQRESLLRECYKNTFRAEPLVGAMHPQVMAAYFYERARCESDEETRQHFFTSLSQVLNQNANSPWTHFYWGILHLQDNFPAIEPSVLTSFQMLQDALKAGEYRAAQVLYQLEIERHEHEEEIPELKVDLVSPLKKLLKLGDNTTLMQLGEVYRAGMGTTERDEKKAEEFYKRSLNEAGEISAAIELTTLFFKTSVAEAKAEDFKKGMDYLTSTADEMMSPVLTLRAGHFYSDRAKEWALENDFQNVKSYFNQARRWFLYAYNLGVAEAAKEVGSMYVLGSGVKTNYKKAQRWFDRAFNMGCGDAVLHLVDMMHLGSIPGGLEVIDEWLKKGARIGSTLAMYRLYTNYIAEYEWENDPTIVCWIAKIGMDSLIPVDLHLVNRSSFVVAMLPHLFDEANQMKFSTRELVTYRGIAEAEGLLVDRFASRLDELQQKAQELKLTVMKR